MKHRNLLKTMLLLCALIAGTSSAWAAEETYSYTFNASSGISKGDNTLGGITWNINHDSSYSANEATGYHVGSGSKSVSYLQLSTSDIPGTISKVVVNAKGNGSSGTVSVSVNGDDYTATDDAITSSFKDFEFTGSSKGEIVIRLSYPSAVTKNFYIASVDVTYEETAPGTVDTPTFSPAAGPVERNTKVTISSTDGATIYYTTDGSEPTTSSSVYSVAITIDAAKTIKAFAVKSGLTDSEVATAAYTIAKVATPTFDPAAGEVDKDYEITISCETADATIYYTTDGSTPTASSTAYDPASKPTIDDDKTIKAIAIKANYIDSDVSSASYTYARVKSYNLVTSVSQIVSGKHYLIANAKEGSVVVMDAQNSNNRGQKTATFSGSTLQAKSAREFIIQGPDKNGWYAIYDAVEDGYLYAASSGSNYLKTDAYTSNSPFAITINANYEANIVGKGSYTRNIMRYNSTSNLFSCYGSGQNPIYLFELDGEETPTESVTVGDKGYITYTTLNAVSFPSGLKSYCVTATGADQVTLTETGASVPARTPLVIEAVAGEYELTSVVSPASAEGNLLKEAMSTTTGDGSTIYALGVGKTGSNEGKVGFYLVGKDVKVPAGKAYLKITGGSAKEFLTFDFDDDATSIEETLSDSPVKGENIYNLAGQRLQKMQKGINIVNGKKVLK